MTSSRPKTLSGPEFTGSDQLTFSDVTDWVVGGGTEAAKAVLDEFDWTGEPVVGVTLKLSPDNKKVVSGNLFVTGELMKSAKEVRANRLFGQAEKDLRISYIIEDASVLTFNSGTGVGDYIDAGDITWSVLKKTRGETIELNETEYSENNIGEFCLRPFLIPLSSQKARLTILAFPLSKAKLETDHPLSKKAAFPGLELTVLEIDLFPLGDKETGKAWGCPLLPLLQLGGNEDDHPNIPETSDIKAAISRMLRSVVVPTSKRDLRTLESAWNTIKVSGSSKMKEKVPDLLWPDWPLNQSEQHGKYIYRYNQILRHWNRHYI